MLNDKCNKIILEKSRIDLINKTQRESPQRVNRANSYSISNCVIDANAFLNDWIVINCEISGNGNTYKANIAIKNTMTNLILAAKNDNKHYVNSKLIQSSLKKSLDHNDVYVDCSCPDFVYTYSYFATNDNFKWGKLQTSNGKRIRNPKNDKGAICKHLYALLRSNKFINLISDKCMRTIMINLDVLYDKYKFDLNEFIVNTKNYDALIKSQLKRDSSGKFIKKQNINIEPNKEDNHNELSN